MPYWLIRKSALAIGLPSALVLQRAMRRPQAEPHRVSTLPLASTLRTRPVPRLQHDRARQRDHPVLGHAVDVPFEHLPRDAVRADQRNAAV